MKIDRNQSFYTNKVNKESKLKPNNQSGLKFRKALTTDTVSFSGMRTVVGSDGHLVDKFYLPKNLKASTIQLCMQKAVQALGVGKYKKMSRYNVDESSTQSYDLKQEDTKNASTEIPTSKADRAYFFQINGKRVLDTGKINDLFTGDLKTIADKSKMVNILSDFGEVTVNKAGNMTLIFPDSVTNNRDKKRNCVNQLGGKLTNITKMIDDFQKAGYHRLVLTLCHPINIGLLTYIKLIKV